MQKKNEQTMKRIFEAAEVLFSQNDFYNVKIEEIAKLAEVGKGTIYTYFKSKEELLCKCVLNNIDQNQAEAISIIDSKVSFQEKFENVFYNMYAFFKRKGPLLHQLMNVGPKCSLSEQDYIYMREKFRIGLDILSSFFQLGIDEGIIKDILTPRQLAIIFQKIFDFNIIFSFYGEPEMSIDDARNFFTNAFFKTGVMNENI